MMNFTQNEIAFIVEALQTELDDLVDILEEVLYSMDKTPTVSLTNLERGKVLVKNIYRGTTLLVQFWEMYLCSEERTIGLSQARYYQQKADEAEIYLQKAPVSFLAEIYERN